MNSLQECVNEYIKNGYTRNYAISKVCQDTIINRIYNSKYSDKITIKGGVVMFHLTQNIRRATIDIDMDLINMSIATDNIVNIFMELGKLDNIDSFKLEKEDISNIIYLVLSDNMFVQNLSNNNNWTGQSIANILETIKKYVAKL